MAGRSPPGVRSSTEAGAGGLTISGDVSLGLTDLSIGGAGNILVSGAVKGSGPLPANGLDEKILNR